jgi:HEPN domain-containing protein
MGLKSGIYEEGDCNMNVLTIKEQWRILAQNDIELAEVVLDRKNWPYVVFFCQQALEKLTKGLHLFFLGTDPPRIHKIDEIVRLFANKLPEPVSDSRYELFSKLSKFYLEGRYPDINQELKFQVDENVAKSFFSQTKEAFEWLLSLKPLVTDTQKEQSKSSPKP